jgi:hypothetical protein
VAVDFVDRYAAAAGKRLMEVRYDYIVGETILKLWVTATQLPDGPDGGPRPFVKEPKLALGLGGASYRPTTVQVLAADASLLREIDLVNEPRLQDPRRGTVQIHFDRRARVRFSDNGSAFVVTGRASQTPTYRPNGRPSEYGARADWEGAAFGFDRWASLANGRDELAQQPCAPYCKQGGGGQAGLSRKWELAKFGREPYIGLMLHAWEGGSGLPDCLCCAKAFVPREAHTAYVSFRSV